MRELIAGAALAAAGWFVANGILTLLLILFLCSARGHAGAHARGTQQFLAVQQFFHERMHEPLQLAHLARVAELHPTYFFARFRELVGVRELVYMKRRWIGRPR